MRKGVEHSSEPRIITIEQVTGVNDSIECRFQNLIDQLTAACHIQKLWCYESPQNSGDHLARAFILDEALLVFEGKFDNRAKYNRTDLPWQALRPSVGPGAQIVDELVAFMLGPDQPK
jgi:hypothetical protein